MAYRQVLNPWFSPTAIARTEPLMRRRSIEMIEALRPAGRCDLAQQLAMELPTEVFLAHLGLPIEDGTAMLPLVEAMFRGFFGGKQPRRELLVERQHHRQQGRRSVQVASEDRVATLLGYSSIAPSYMLSSSAR